MKRRQHDNERGSATLEAVIIVPVFFLLIGILLVGIRVNWAHQAVESAAAAAARDASIARTTDQAQTQAMNAATVSMAQSGAHCTNQNASLDTSNFNAPLGQAGKVSVTLTCEIPLSNLIPGIPGSTTVTRTSVSPVDPYRQR